MNSDYPKYQVTINTIDEYVHINIIENGLSSVIDYRACVNAIYCLV